MKKRIWVWFFPTVIIGLMLSGIILMPIYGKIGGLPGLMGAVALGFFIGLPKPETRIK